MDLLHWPHVANAVLIKALGDKAVFRVLGLEEYKVKSGKNIGQVIPCLLLEHNSGNKTRLSLSTAQHMKDLNSAGFTDSKKLIGCRLVLEIQSVKAFGERVPAVRIKHVLGVDSIQIEIEAPKEDPDTPTTKEWGELNEILDDEQ